MMVSLKKGKRNVIISIIFMLYIELCNFLLLAIFSSIDLKDINRLIIALLLAFLLFKGKKIAKLVVIILASVGILLWIRLGYQFLLGYYRLDIELSKGSAVFMGFLFFIFAILSGFTIILLLSKHSNLYFNKQNINKSVQKTKVIELSKDSAASFGIDSYLVDIIISANEKIIRDYTAILSDEEFKYLGLSKEKILYESVIFALWTMNLLAIPIELFKLIIIRFVNKYRFNVSEFLEAAEDRSKCYFNAYGKGEDLDSLIRLSFEYCRNINDKLPFTEFAVVGFPEMFISLFITNGEIFNKLKKGTVR